ncbi:MAG: hypothetical protein PQ612_00020 [Rickettsiales bacterium]|nr:hypothetical protein [Pseudomonadota bacterium]MDA0965698.1 hypothetical protein [Pseudomonadota bacterium]MDG4543022.1 hypothetical protein [Rickettsiales bacterium]MDG4544530.1 hypothetical protein [Rickettsiales bacterium]MDG4546652.1 hypothetical protein [Rickettsiales bacterium]
MKKFLPLLILTLVASACASKPKGSSTVLGKVTVINEYGSDITKYCRANIDKTGLFSQSAGTGSNGLEQITCINGGDVYRIKGNRLSVNVPAENSTVDFGTVEITLNGDASYKVSGGDGKISVGDTTKGWSKHDTRNIR